MSSSVIDILRDAYQADPNNLDIALHLASLLAESDSAQDALSIYQQILSKQPNDIPALTGALQCANKLGNANLASAYQKMLDAFGHPASTTSDTPEPPPATSASTDTTPTTTGNATLLPKLRVVGGTDAEPDTVLDSEQPKLKLDDVGGMENVKRRLQLSFLGPLQNPALMSAYGKNVSGGLLLYGPPGCGKTYIARALAGELGAKFITVGLSDVLDMYLGESERRLHELFENARRETPAVLFFDELDAMGQKRSHLRNSGMRSVVNQLLAEMDSVGVNNSNLFMIGATNHPWDVDSALKRPGRFDRMVAVFPPDEAARLSILNYHLKDKPVDNLDVARIAQQCQRFSGADLRYMIETAIEFALEDSLASGQVRPLQMADFTRAMRDINPSTQAWFETARNYALFANDGGSYDELVQYIREHKL